LPAPPLLPSRTVRQPPGRIKRISADRSLNSADRISGSYFPGNTQLAGVQPPLLLPTPASPVDVTAPTRAPLHGRCHLALAAEHVCRRIPSLRLPSTGIIQGRRTLRSYEPTRLGRCNPGRQIARTLARFKKLKTNTRASQLAARNASSQRALVNPPASHDRASMKRSPAAGREVFYPSPLENHRF